ncbi:proton-conducting transporter membrane subunit [Zavarzinia compransoris]|uniref:Cation:proton antiporter n=1 Tax=Zavarzinia compransoris TaxID=1264899 RepID=A0A317E0G8_9PROT|nr:proton-conducting transporter membrane subunit [Zavarzinia compransoris]PWR19590.1 cation:proton antiporter [Zavarzinia compransoris]TDP40426.1 multisubunit sodium/proton antiporter MrpD subunit [Zavarzinia compransoris]
MTILDHAPVLVVVLPLLAAPVVAVLPRPALAGAATAIVAALDLALALYLLVPALDGAVISYPLGNWLPPIGIEYRIDLLAAAMTVLIAGSGTLTALMLPTALGPEVAPGDRPRLFAAFLLCLAGLIGMVVTGDLFNVFVFLEIASLSTYVLIAAGAGRDRRALTAAFDYLVLGATGATFFVIGIAFLYIATGTLNMADLGERLPGAGRRAIIVGSSFLFVGLALKAAMLPLHRWLPNAYAYAPAAVTTFLAMTATKVSLYLLIRLADLVFQTPGELGRVNFAALLPPIGLAMLITGSVMAVTSKDLKRLLAFSSIANLGLMLAALGLGGVAGIAAALINLFNHAIIKGGAFAVTAGIVHRRGSAGLAALAGLSRQMPIAFALLVVAGLGLIGVPLTAGFVSKLAVLQIAAGRDLWLVAGGILLASLITVVYIWRVVEAAMLAPPAEDMPKGDLHPAFLLPAGVLAAATIGLGIDSRPVVELATRIAGQIVGGGG